MKIGIIGAGNVGLACLLTQVMRGVASEIVVVNRHRERAEGLVTMPDTARFCPVRSC